jgi:ATP-dependent Clp protease ATP-binding subunit ClpA
MGARPLRRAIQRLIEDRLADEVLGGTLAEGSTILVDRDGDEMNITVREPEPDKVGAAAGPAADEPSGDEA